MSGELVDHSVLDFPEIVIHGNIARARQLGYNSPAIVSGIDDNVKDHVSAAFGLSPSELNDSHFYGNPAFCIHLTLKDFFATYDNRFGCTIESCGVCEFPVESTLKNENRLPSWDGWEHSLGAVGTNRYDRSDCYCRFKPSFSVNLYVIENTQIVRTVPLFGKDDQGPPNQWKRDTWKYPDNSMLSFQLSETGERPVILAIGMYASCSCNQAGIHRPVFAKAINEYIPEVKPYVWRMCEDHQWHLTRPVYIANSSTSWENIEEKIKRENMNS